MLVRYRIILRISIYIRYTTVSRHTNRYSWKIQKKKSVDGIVDCRYSFDTHKNAFMSFKNAFRISFDDIAHIDTDKKCTQLESPGSIRKHLRDTIHWN